MSVRVNLLPDAYQIRARRPERFKLWLLVAAGVVTGQVLVAAVLRAKTDDVRRTQQQTEQLQQYRDQLVKDLADHSAEYQIIEKQVALSLGLRRKHRWSRTISLLSEHLPEKALLTKLESNPPRYAGGGSGRSALDMHSLVRKGKDQTKQKDANIARGMLLAGIAADHESVAVLLGKLDERPEFGTCELKSTSRQPFHEDFAVVFSIAITWE